MANVKYACNSRYMVERFAAKLYAAGIAYQADPTPGGVYIITTAERMDEATDLYESVARPNYTEWRAAALYEMAIRNETRAELADAIHCSSKAASHNLAGRHLSRKVLNAISKRYELPTPALKPGALSKSRDDRIW